MARKYEIQVELQADDAERKLDDLEKKAEGLNQKEREQQERLREQEERKQQKAAQDQFERGPAGVAAALPGPAGTLFRAGGATALRSVSQLSPTAVAGGAAVAATLGFRAGDSGANTYEQFRAIDKDLFLTDRQKGIKKIEAGLKFIGSNAALTRLQSATQSTEFVTGNAEQALIGLADDFGAAGISPSERGLTDVYKQVFNDLIIRRQRQLAHRQRVIGIMNEMNASGMNGTGLAAGSL